MFTKSIFSRSSKEKKCIDVDSAVETDRIVFRWSIIDFHQARDICKSNGGEPLTSPVYVDKTGAEWWVRFYPFDCRYNEIGSSSIFVHTDRTQSEDVVASVYVSMQDGYFTKIAGGSESIYMHRLKASGKNENIGIFNILSSASIESCWDRLRELNIMVEINIFDQSTNLTRDRMGIKWHD